MCCYYYRLRACPKKRFFVQNRIFLELFVQKSFLIEAKIAFQKTHFFWTGHFLLQNRVNSGTKKCSKKVVQKMEGMEDELFEAVISLFPNK
jgi:hypothetical protein